MGLYRGHANLICLSFIQEETEMNYIHDIHANFQDICYDFYEWNKNDKIIKIKKIPIFTIDHSKLKLIIRDESKVDLQFLTLIEEKTEIYNCKSRINACLLTDGRDIIALKINKNGIIIKKSFFLPEEELDVLESVPISTDSRMKIEQIQPLKKQILTRHERERKKFLLKNMFKMDDKKIFYLYFECFNLEESNRTSAVSRLKKEIKGNNDRICSISYSFLKLIYANS